MIFQALIQVTGGELLDLPTVPSGCREGRSSLVAGQVAGND
jgi:hypothetical protein